MKVVTTEWLRSAHDDLMVIREILSNDALTHMVAFHAQQAIEKSFKAVLEEYDGLVPRIHVLETLLPRVRRYLDCPIDLELLEELDKLYLDSRYPGNFGLLPAGKPGMNEARRFSELAHAVSAEISAFLQAPPK